MVCSGSLNKADLVFTHGNIIAMNDALPCAEAIAVGDGKIVYVGNNQKAMELAGKSGDVIDLQGLTMISGIHDAHTHALDAGSEVGGNCWLHTKTTQSSRWLINHEGLQWVMDELPQFGITSITTLCQYSACY